MRTITAQYIKPPIPTNRFDWVAYIEGADEYGPYAFGPSEREAISQLKKDMGE